MTATYIVMSIVAMMIVITFRMSCRRREMYCSHTHLFVYLSVRGRMPTLLHGRGCKLGEW